MGQVCFEPGFGIRTSNKFSWEWNRYWSYFQSSLEWKIFKLRKYVSI